MKRSSFHHGRFELFSGAIGGLIALEGHSEFSDSSNSLQQGAAARCLSLFDARLDEMSDAPEETSWGSLRQLLKGATGYETQLTSSTLATFSLSQVSLHTKEELVACRF